jgi:hypothetical protein
MRRRTRRLLRFHRFRLCNVVEQDAEQMVTGRSGSTFSRNKFSTPLRNSHEERTQRSAPSDNEMQKNKAPPRANDRVFDKLSTLTIITSKMNPDFAVAPRSSVRLIDDSSRPPVND